MGRKVGEVAVPLSGVWELGPHLIECGLGEAYLCTKWHLVHPALWLQQTWAVNSDAVPLWGRELCSHLTQCGLDRGLPSYRVAS